MTRNVQTKDRQSLVRELDILRQMVLLARGSDDPLYVGMDEALQEHDPEKIDEMIRAYDDLPEQEKNLAMGLDPDEDIA